MQLRGRGAGAVEGRKAAYSLIAKGTKLGECAQGLCLLQCEKVNRSQIDESHRSDLRLAECSGPIRHRWLLRAPILVFRLSLASPRPLAPPAARSPEDHKKKHAPSIH